MLSFFPRGVLDEILNLIESVSECFPSYSHTLMLCINTIMFNNFATNKLPLVGLTVVHLVVSFLFLSHYSVNS